MSMDVFVLTCSRGRLYLLIAAFSVRIVPHLFVSALPEGIIAQDGRVPTWALKRGIRRGGAADITTPVSTLWRASRPTSKLL